MEKRETYPLAILFEDLPLSILQLSRKTGINEVTIARVRDGMPTRRSTANKLLMAFSQIYEKEFNLRNVTGINVQVNKRLEKKEKASSAA